jgi:hypothetical protein
MRIIISGFILCLGFLILFAWQPQMVPWGKTPKSHLEFPGNGPLAFHTHPIWDTGKAEFAVYQSNFVKYGISRKFETDVILIREFFHPEKLVKADQSDTPGAIPVFKMNRIRSIETGVYSYHQNLSAFVHRSQPSKLVKLASSSLDGCGMSYSEIRASASELHGEFHSYWEKGISGRLNLGPSDRVIHDQLPLYLRAKDLSHYSGESIKLLGSLFSSYLRELPVMEVQIQNLGIEDLSLSSTIHKAYHLRLEGKGINEDLWFRASPTQPLLRWNHSDGSSDTLRSLRYLYYWKYTGTGDRAKTL